MKKAMVYLLALTLAFSAMLSGCGRGTDRPTDPTAAPQTSAPPETMMPNPEDGVVRDRDGIITDGDSGGKTTPDQAQKPAAGTGTVNGSGAAAGINDSGKL